MNSLEASYKEKSSIGWGLQDQFFHSGLEKIEVMVLARV